MEESILRELEDLRGKTSDLSVFVYLANIRGEEVFRNGVTSKRFRRKLRPERINPVRREDHKNLSASLSQIASKVERSDYEAQLVSIEKDLARVDQTLTEAGH